MKPSQNQKDGGWLIFKSGWDGKEIQLPATDYFRQHYRMFGAKCWAAWCSNAGIIIHFSRTGKADRTYCYHDRYNPKTIADGRLYGGHWFIFSQGRMYEVKDK